MIAAIKLACVAAFAVSVDIALFADVTLLLIVEIALLAERIFALIVLINVACVAALVNSVFTLLAIVSVLL